MTGSEFAKTIEKLRGPEREKVLLDAVEAGEFPNAFDIGPAGWPSVLIGGRLLIRVSPDFFAVGTDADPYYIGGSTATAQTIAFAFDSILPSKKIAREISAAAAAGGHLFSLYSVNPGAPWYEGDKPKDIEASGAFTAANVKRNKLLSNALGDSRWKVLVDGHAKNILTQAGGLKGSCGPQGCVTIYGAGGGTVDGWAIQQKFGGHSWDYVDYSHGIRLVSRHAVLDGKDVDLRDLFLSSDPSVVALVSDEGSFDPFLPRPASLSKKDALIQNVDRKATSSPGFGLVAVVATLGYLALKKA